jgi:hypothetical protein
MSRLISLALVALALASTTGTASFASTLTKFEQVSAAQKYLDEALKYEREHPRMIYANGTKSCGQWSADLANEGASLTPRATDQAWVLGFVSGVGFAGSYLPKTDSEAVTRWIDNYCAANPLANVNDAATELVRALWRTVPR